jgi:hypothetical protein
MNQLTHQEQKIVVLIAKELELKNRTQVAYLFGQHANIEEITVGRIKKGPFLDMRRPKFKSQSEHLA